MRSSEDAFVDMLVGEAPALGLPLLAAEYPRAYVDLNRSCDELDPAVIDGLRRSPANPRISSGLGVIPRVVSGGRLIYRGKVSMAEAEARIAEVWRPYHSRLEALMQDSLNLFGEAILLDIHSMPHEALENVAPKPGRSRPEVVLGDRFGASCNSEIVDRLEQAFVDQGLVVSRNSPFAGAFMTQHYGRPAQSRHAIQIEIDRSLYMNETMIRPNGNFQAMKRIMTDVMQRMIDTGLTSIPLAAE